MTADYIDLFRNQGGFDMIMSGRDKIKKEEEFAGALHHCTQLELDGLVVIGGDVRFQTLVGRWRGVA